MNAKVTKMTGDKVVSPSELFAELMSRLIAANDQRGQDAEQLTELISRVPARSLAKHADLVYRCTQRGCLLLAAFRTPNGVLLHLPRYRHSPKVNERNSVPAARAEKTSDGDRRWIARSLFLDQVFAEHFIALNCNHLLNRMVRPDEIETRLAAGGGVLRL